MGRITESFVVHSLRAYLYVQGSIFLFEHQGYYGRYPLHSVSAVFSKEEKRFHKNEQLFYFLSDSYDFSTQSSSDYLRYE